MIRVVDELLVDLLGCHLLRLLLRVGHLAHELLLLGILIAATVHLVPLRLA